LQTNNLETQHAQSVRLSSVLLLVAVIFYVSFAFAKFIIFSVFVYFRPEFKIQSCARHGEGEPPHRKQRRRRGKRTRVMQIRVTDIRCRSARRVALRRLAFPFYLGSARTFVEPAGYLSRPSCIKKNCLIETRSPISARDRICIY